MKYTILALVCVVVVLCSIMIQNVKATTPCPKVNVSCTTVVSIAILLSKHVLKLTNIAHMVPSNSIINMKAVHGLMY
jgi:hypothetical protein